MSVVDLLHKIMTMKAITIAILSIFFSISTFAAENPKGTPAPAATAGISGLVLDKISGEALGGVEITVAGTDQHFYTDFDGKFDITGLVPGSYDIIVSYISYEKSLLERVNIKANNENALDIRLVSTK